MRALDEFTAGLVRTHPDLIDRWEATAVVESLGYSDSRVLQTFGLASTQALGAHVFRVQTLSESAGRRAARTSLADDVGYTRTVTSSLIYALPWFLVFLAESRNPDLLLLAPAVAAPLSLALMASLVVSGGFVQAIARRAQFYVAIRQVALARSTCLILISSGLATAGVVALGGVLLGWYFSLFSLSFLVLAALYFVVATALWMECAVLGLGTQAWRIPVVFLVGALGFAAGISLGVGTLVAQVGAAAVALLCAAAQTPRIFASRVEQPVFDAGGVNPAIVAHGLAPHFLYGVLYFTFLVADRVSAGAAAASAGSLFGAPRTYKDGMDVALLTFLLSAAVIECCNLAMMRGWRATGALPLEGEFTTGKARLRTRRRLVNAALVAAFVTVAAFVRAIAEPLTGRSIAGFTDVIVLVGQFGYLLFAVGLLNALTLLSLNRINVTVRALAAAVAVNLIVGGILGHVFSAFYAVAGLTAGAALFAALTSSEVTRALNEPDTAYVTM